MQCLFILLLLLVLYSDDRNAERMQWPVSMQHYDQWQVVHSAILQQNLWIVTKIL